MSFVQNSFININTLWSITRVISQVKNLTDEAQAILGPVAQKFIDTIQNKDFEPEIYESILNVITKIVSKSSLNQILGQLKDLIASSDSLRSNEVQN